MESVSPHGVGILAMEVYFPSNYVTQPDLEVAYGASKGKYTIGLGQEAMAFTGDLEDINSICLTVVQSLMEKYDISPNEIGRLEVGTESLVDKSKSTKTVLMSLFAESGNTDIEGATVTNACYGGTAALLNALAWADSSAWDGRFAIVVAADIAVYADGPARPTGGCGAVALLVGRNSPLQIDLQTRTTHASNVWDFFKSQMESEYPTVNGGLSQTCYLRALEDCYTRFVDKCKAKRGMYMCVDQCDYLLFHSPYNKLVQKSFARLLYRDMIADRGGPAITAHAPALAAWAGVPPEATYDDKALETALKGVSGPLYKEKVDPTCKLSKQIGNTYTASVYMNLANLVSNAGEDLAGKEVVLFSYGSGALASMFRIVPMFPNPNPNPTSLNTPRQQRFSLVAMQQALDLPNRLAARTQSTAENLSLSLHAREAAHGQAPFVPSFSTSSLAPGTFYLESINGIYERVYSRTPLQDTVVVQQPYGSGEPSPFRSISGEPIFFDEGEPGAPASPRPPVLFNDPPVSAIYSPVRPRLDSKGLDSSSTRDSTFSPMTGIPRPQTLTRNKTMVWASGRPLIRVVVTGIAAALPGREKDVFQKTSDPITGKPLTNVQRIIAGEMFISPIPAHVKDDMLAKNVYTAVRQPDGTTKKMLLKSHEECINVCASIGRLDLSVYGVSASIAATMDRAVQVAIASGLEALKDAGLVCGTYIPPNSNPPAGTSAWELPLSMQSTTGIVYATSFPALDTAIEEVAKFYNSQTLASLDVSAIVAELKRRLEASLGETLSPDTLSALDALREASQQVATSSTSAGTTAGAGTPSSYEFDRKFLFRVLVLGNAQLAQIVKARGPNAQTNAACAGATQAIAIAYDMIQVGRAERMIVIAGDSASSDTLMPWLGNGFRILGAACTKADTSEACMPFQQARSGMILGSGGIGMVLESEEGARRRYDLARNPNSSSSPLVPMPQRAYEGPFRCRLLGTLISNSAYHGAAMDRKHIAEEMERFLVGVEQAHDICRKEIAQHGVYFSHETSTHASPSSSCASNEIYALREVFGEDLKDLLILNTKGFTGHPMGVSFEDVVAAEVLMTGQVPPIANMKEGAIDPHLGGDLKMSKGGAYPCKYAMRFAAGFGSQIALALYGVASLEV